MSGEIAITGHGAAAITITYVTTSGQPFPSLPWMMTVEEPVAVGVPASRPLADSVRPAGNVPLNTVKVYDPDPPLAVICWL